MEPQAGVRVWDLPVRVVHWLLAIAVVGAWWTGENLDDWFTVHQYCGYAVVVLVVFRLGWGFIGTRTARFSSFLAGPSAVFAHLRHLRDRALVAHAGHPASGGWAALVIWGVLLAQGVMGLFANDEVMNTGPFYGWVAPEVSNLLSGWHHEMGEFIPALVLVHIAAVLVYRFWGGQDLVSAMLTGRRTDVPVAEDIGRERWLLALVWFAVVLATFIALLRAAPPAILEVY